ncbi:MAG TPA: DsrE family protein [Bacteroidota bacterium]|nr:DsrE family protein [Bacteroidota bacterium]
MKLHRIVLLSLLFALGTSFGFAQEKSTMGNADQPTDADALKGVTTIKTVYDINNVTEAKKMIVFLKAIIDARDRAQAAKVKTDLVIAFRGPALNLVQKPGTDATDEQKQIAELVADLKKGGAKLEACDFAIQVLKLDRASFLPEVKVVANTFNSLGGYQAKGYGVIRVE